MEEQILNLGCGKTIIPNATNLDILPLKGVNIVHDLNEYPLPFKTNRFDKILCWHILEHLENIIKIMEEIHRIGKPNAIIEIKVPYFVSAWAFSDPAHKHYFTLNSFNYFLEEKEYNFYTKARFKIVSKKLEMLGGIKTINQIIISLAEKFPRFYERYLCTILKCDTITFVLSVEKKEAKE